MNPEAGWGREDALVFRKGKMLRLLRSQNVKFNIDSDKLCYRLLS